MRSKITAIMASLTVFALALNAQAKPKPPAAKPAAPAAPAKPVVAAPAAPAVDAKKAEAEAKAKADAEAKAKAAAPAAPAAPAVAEAPLPDKPSGFNVGGNIVQSYTYNPKHPQDGYNGTLTWTDRANEYQLNQAWVYVEVPTDTSKKDFDWGFRADTMFGSSYRWATSAGFEDKFKFNTGNGGAGQGLGSKQYGLAIPQLYADVAYKSLKLRVGHIISPVGFFTVDTTQNVFMTIPYTYAYGEPFTHFGAFLYYEIMKDKLTVMAGPTKGGDNLDGAGVGSKPGGLLGTVTYIFDDKSQFDWVVHASREYNLKGTLTSNTLPAQSLAAGSYNPSDNLYSWRYFQTLVYKRYLTKDLQWVLQSDLGIQKVADVESAINGGQRDKEITAMWYGANTYLIYQLMQQLQLAVNFEWFRDTAGARVGSVLPTLASSSTVVGGMNSPAAACVRCNYVGNFFTTSFGPKWMPAKNFFVRLNGRYDYFDGTSINRVMGSTTTGGASLPFGDGDSRHQFVVGLDAALLF